MTKLILTLSLLFLAGIPNFIFAQFNAISNTNTLAIKHADASYLKNVGGQNKKSAVEIADAKYFKNQGKIDAGTERTKTQTLAAENNSVDNPYAENIEEESRSNPNPVIIEDVEKTIVTNKDLNKKKVFETKKTDDIPQTRNNDNLIPEREKQVENSTVKSQPTSAEKESFEQTNTTNKWKTDLPITNVQTENIEQGFYIVQKGETLYRVSVNTKIPIDKLKQINSLATNNVPTGTKLLLAENIKETNVAKKELTPVKTTKWKTDVPLTENQEENIKNGFYIVSEGETMYRVSVNTKISIDKIKELNKLKSNNLYPGTKLIIK